MGRQARRRQHYARYAGQDVAGAAPGLGDGLIDWSAGLASGLFDGWVVDPLSVEGLNGDYDLPNHEVLHVTKDHGLPLTFWRSVGHSFTAFAKETMVDELAEKGGIDGVELRLRNTRNNLRLNNVIRVAGERMGAMQPGAGRTLGFAAHSSFGTYVAEVAEVSVAQGGIKVHKVFCVVDCGRAINPDIVRAQMEGAVMYGLTAALHGNLELENGRFGKATSTTTPSCAWTQRRLSKWRSSTATRAPPEWANRVCRPSPRQWPTRFTERRAKGLGHCLCGWPSASQAPHLYWHTILAPTHARDWRWDLALQRQGGRVGKLGE